MSVQSDTHHMDNMVTTTTTTTTQHDKDTGEGVTGSVLTAA
jgi:hypothetical protein